MNAQARTLALILAMFGAAATGETPVPDLTNPAQLFKTVCLGDEVALPKESFRAVRYSKLPSDVKMVLGYSLPLIRPESVMQLAPMPPSEVPNSIFVLLPSKNAYLLVPAPGKVGRAASHCVVIWRGNHYADALAVAKAIPSPIDLSPMLSNSRGVPGANSVSVQSGGMIIGAAEFNGWTLIRIAPDNTTQEQTTP